MDLENGRHIPLEIVSIIFSNLVHDLLKDKRVQDARELLLVSKTVQAVVGPLLYRKIKVPDKSSSLLQLFRMMNRHRIAPWVQEISLEERWELGPGDRYINRSHEDANVEEMAEAVEELAEAAETLKSKFGTNGERISSKEESWIQGIRNTGVVAWAVLVQLSNLVSLTLETRTGEFAQMATLLRLPRLEDLTLTIEVGFEGKYTADVPFDEVLDSIISSTDRLKSLTFEDISGSCSFPPTHDAPKLKQILSKHAAQTLEHLSIILAIHDESDWRLPQECTDISGSFGSMKNFVKLEKLSIQLELLLGRPEDGEHQLKDVLPPQLKELMCVPIADYHGQEHDLVWEIDDILSQFEKLAEAAEDGQSYTSLCSVKVDLFRKDEFNTPSHGELESGILDRSRIYFGWC